MKPNKFQPDYLCPMIQKLFRLLVLVSCVLVGWALGYIRVPYVEQNYSFWVGFVGGLGFIAFIAALIFVGNKKIVPVSLVGKGSDSKRRKYSFVWVLTVLVFMSVTGFGIVVYQQNRSFKALIQNQQTRIRQQTQLIDSVKQSKLMSMMSNLLDKVDKEVKNSANKTLSDETIARAGALGAAFKPYKYFEGDNILNRVLSPERGQLLLALSAIKMDSSSFKRIKQQVSFAGADLRRADLRQADLDGVNLSNANLRQADLRGANLKNADLRKANLSWANLNGAKLSDANIKRANLSWAELNEVDLEKANLDGSDLTSAKLRKANLREASIRWVDLTSGLLNEADLTASDLARSVLVKTNLTNAKLTDAYLKGVDFRDAILDGTATHKNWLKNLQDKKLEIIGVEEVVKRYKMSADTLNENGHPVYSLEQILN